MNLLEFLGLRHTPQHRDYAVREYPLNNGEVIYFADWLHPNHSPDIGAQAFSEEVIGGYREFLTEGDFCIDIGAQTGETSLLMGIAAGKTGCVLALEPNPDVYHVLEKNVRANRHLANIMSIMAAAASEQGFLEYGGRHTGAFCVDLSGELRTHYSRELEKLKFIRVDAEGFDLNVLKSLTGIIDQYRPAIKAEVFKKTGSDYRLELFSLFDERNYAVYEIVGEPLQAGRRLTQDTLMKSTTYGIICVPVQTALEFETAWRPE